MPPYSKQDVSDKFSDLHNKYYVPRGYMISPVNDDVAKKFVETHPELVWTFGYNSYARANIQTAEFPVTIFGKQFTILLERPLYRVERSEFECYFGFGGHCEGFTLYRMIARFATTVEEHGFDYQTLLNDGHLEEEKSKENLDITTTELKEVAKPIDIQYIQNVFKLLVMGGYVKYWKAWDELSQWFLQNTEDHDESIRTWLQTEFPKQISEKNCLSTINKYIFDSM
jgi:hypothetical protein